MEISLTSYIVPSDKLSRNSSDFKELAKKSLNTTDQSPEKKSYYDAITLSPEGQDLALSQPSSEKGMQSRLKPDDTRSLGNQEIQQLMKLKQRDIEVRNHEQAHLAVAGQYSRGGASFTYQKGPDGASYAVGGEVGIDVSKERTPEATIAKMQIIKRAALAPASPSPTDRSIAAKATIMESQARQEALIKIQEELLHRDNPPSPVTGQEAPIDNKLISKNTSTSPAYTTLKTMLAAYQRTAGYIQ